MRQRDLLLITPLAALLSCSSNVGSLKVSVVLAPGEEEAFARDVSWMRLSVDGPDVNISSGDISLTDKNRTGHLDKVPVGKERRLTVEGLDPDKTVIYRGRSSPLEIKDGTTQISLYMGRVDRPAFSYINNRSLTSARAFHRATLLPDGSVLLTGGFDGRWRPEEKPLPLPIRSAEIIDGNALRAVATKPMIQAHLGHTATLNAKGNVVIAGGMTIEASPTDGGVQPPDAGAGPGPELSRATFVELFDSINNKFVKGADLVTERDWHSAALTVEGVMLVGGSTNGATATKAVEAYTDGTLRILPGLKKGRRAFALTALPDGSVIASGGLSPDGQALSSIEIWTPSSKKWRTVALMSKGRAFHTATLLDDGTVLLVGGLSSLGSVLEATSLVELFDPKRDRVTDTWDRSRAARWCHTTTLLEDGRVLLAGGFLHHGGAGMASDTPSALVDEIQLMGEKMQFVDAPTMKEARAGHTATLLRSGALLITGGVSGGNQPNDTAEVYILGPDQTAPR